MVKSFWITSRVAFVLTVEYEMSNCNWSSVCGKVLLYVLSGKGNRMGMLSSPLWRWLKFLSSIQMLSPVAWCVHSSWHRVCALAFGGGKKKTVNELQSLQYGSLKLPCGVKHVFGDWTYRYSWSTRFPSLPFQEEGGFHSQHRPTSHWENLAQISC